MAGLVSQPWKRFSTPLKGFDSSEVMKSLTWTINFSSPIYNIFICFDLLLPDPLSVLLMLSPSFSLWEACSERAVSLSECCLRHWAKCIRWGSVCSGLVGFSWQAHLIDPVVKSMGVEADVHIPYLTHPQSDLKRLLGPTIQGITDVGYVQTPSHKTHCFFY